MRSFVLLCAAGLSIASPALADELVLEYGNVYTGYSEPGDPTYARATFTSTTPGTVSLQLEGFMASSAFISGFYFNLDPSLNLNSLDISHEGGTAPASGGMDIRSNNYSAGGGSRYDIRIAFPTANWIGSPRFNGTDTATFLFTSSDAITASSFNFLGTDRGDYGPFVSAAHVQGLGWRCDKSAWVSGEEIQQVVVVPLPPAAWAGVVSLAGVAGLGAMRRRSMRK